MAIISSTKRWSPGKDDADVEQVEQVPLGSKSAARQGYCASTPEEGRLDRRINLKMDCIVVFVLAAGFLVSRFLKNSAVWGNRTSLACPLREWIWEKNGINAEKFQSVDKGNIGNAATTETFAEDLDLMPNDVPNSVSLYTATFIPCLPISVALGRIVGPGWWLPFIILSWGLVTIVQAVMKNRAQMLALRLLLGVFEAGYVPTSYYMIGTLYPAYQAGFRMGMMALSFTFSGAFSGLISYGCFTLHSPKWEDWQLLFLVQGSVTIFIAFWALVALPGKISRVWFLTQEERAHAIRRMEIDTAAAGGGNNSEEHDHRIPLKNVLLALKDWKKVLIVIGNMCATTPAYGFAIFLPLIVKGMGYSSVKANLMTVPPFMVGAVGLITILKLSDHFRERSGFALLAMAISIIGYIALISSQDNKLRYGFLHVSLIGAGTVNPIIAAWLTDNTPDKATRIIVMGMFGITNVAGVIAGQIFKDDYAPSYRISLIATLIIVVVGVFIFSGIRVFYMLENRKRKREIENWTEQQFEEERLTTERRGHEKKYFMFGY